MKPVMMIAKREFTERVTSPLYITLTIITMILLFVGPVIASVIFATEELKPVNISIIDKSKWLLPKLKQSLEHQPIPIGSDNGLTHQLKLKEIDINAYQHSIELAHNNQIDGLLVIEKDDKNLISVTFSSTSSYTLSKVKLILKGRIQNILTNEKLTRENIPQQLKINLLKPLDYNSTQLSADITSEEFSARAILAMIFSLIMYSAILLYSSMTFQGVLEEKSSRIMEVMVASTKPKNLILGKILGIAALGLLQLTLWIFPYFLLINLPSGLVTESIHQLDAKVFAFMLFYFVAGFLFFGAIYAAAGSTISRTEDSQTLMTPLTIFVMIGYIISLITINNPTSDLAIIASYIPFFSPTVMVTRLVLSEPTVFQIITSASLLILSTIFIIWISAKVYCVGVLHYGRRLSWFTSKKNIELLKHNKNTKKSLSRKM
ncbi:MAG: ABC transporter permease [Colwellia sp.]|nr:ABC transporter permease [Colwellia sp.]